MFGLAGTDHQRRDLMIALLWGTPLALAFGLLAALGTTFTTMVISALGAWFGGWVDGIIQRITEVNMVLPFLSILIMVGTFYSRSLWLMLGVTILLSIFGGTIKTYRAIFLQVKESPYIEAARAYGASNGRIIVQYLVPRIDPAADPGAGDPDPDLCVPGSLAGGAGAGRSRHAHLGQGDQRCPAERSPVSGSLLLDP